MRPDLATSAHQGPRAFAAIAAHARQNDGQCFFPHLRGDARQRDVDAWLINFLGECSLHVEINFAVRTGHPRLHAPGCQSHSAGR